MARTLVASVAGVPRVLWRCRRIHKCWSWREFEEYLEVPLLKIRSEYGIVPMGQTK
jgi:hypothetical protein